MSENKNTEEINAIGFAEWIAEGNIYLDPDGWQTENGTKTTKELYEFYLTRINKVKKSIYEGREKQITDPDFL